MPRRAKIQRRIPTPDARYNSELVTRFINKIMQRGKKGLAERIMYGALQSIQDRTGQDPLDVFERAVANATPMLEVKPRRVGGATYQVPVQIEGQRRQSLAIRWLLTSARNRPGKAMADKLANELLDAYNGTGRHDQTPRRYAPDGGSQSRVLAFPLLTLLQSAGAMQLRR
jgi:small subunit ribosomal protein S7